MVIPDVAEGSAAREILMRPPFITVGPVYVLAPVPNVAKPSPSFVNPPVPEIVPVRLSAPAADDAVVLFTVTVKESVNVIGAEMVLFPVPLADGTLIVAGPNPASSKTSDPLTPVETLVVNVLKSLLKMIEPTT